MVGRSIQGRPLSRLNGRWFYCNACFWQNIHLYKMDRLWSNVTRGSRSDSSKSRPAEIVMDPREHEPKTEAGGLVLGCLVPDFVAETTQRKIEWHRWIGRPSLSCQFTRSLSETQATVGRCSWDILLISIRLPPQNWHSWQKCATILETGWFPQQHTFTPGDASLCICPDK